MKSLIYCIFSSNCSPQMNLSAQGVGGNIVQVVSHNGLAAAVTAISSGKMAEDASTLLSYHKAIESFHLEGTVIPLRFPTVVDQESDVERLLLEQAERYKSLLKKLDGCVEMGVRVIVDEIGPAPVTPESSSSLSVSTGPGAAYLTRLKDRQNAEEKALKANQAIVERYGSFFTGAFADFKSEYSKLTHPFAPSGSILLSLHFLVPEKSLGQFRKIYSELVAPERKKMMLSGPWPPYNFVLPEDYLRA